jgi:hypothetical protein
VRSKIAGGWSAFVIAGLLGAASGCKRREAPPSSPPPREKAVQASPFVCAGPVCTQRHVRLPDDGEWRCAERDGIVWCAGGEPAAGVAMDDKPRGYRCGERRGKTPRERVCVDVAPDYPDGGARAFRCRFEQEHGVVRSCTRAEGTPRPPPSGAAPNCWIDADCEGGCDRGTCAGAG